MVPGCQARHMASLDLEGSPDDDVAVADEELHGALIGTTDNRQQPGGLLARD